MPLRPSAPSRSTARMARAFVVLVCLVVLAGSAWTLWAGHRHALRQARTDTVNLVESVAHHVSHSVRDVEATLGTVGLRLQELEASGQGPASLGPLLELLTDDLPALQAIHVFAADGRLLKHSGPSPALGDGRGQDFFEAPLRPDAAGTHVGLPLRDADGDWFIPVSRRWQGHDGRTGGVVVGALRMAYLTDHFARFDLGREGLLALNTVEGWVLMRHPFVEGALGRDLSDSPLQREHYQHASRGSFRARSPVDGIEREYSHALLDDYPLRAVAALSTREVLEPWRHGALVQGGGTLLLMLMLAGFGRHLVKAARHQARLSAALSDSHRRLQDLTLALDAHAIVAITDVEGTILHANARFCEISGHGERELLGQNHRIVRSDHHDEAFFRSMWQTLAQGRVWKGEIRNRARDGHTYWVDATIVPFLGEDGRPYQYISVSTDITARKEAELNLEQSQQVLQLAFARLSEQASTDALTGLANRRRFNEVFEEEFARAARGGGPLALLMLDVDHFKHFNDRLGHPAGDACLKQVGEAIARAMRRAGDLAARYGGEEFVVLLPGVDAAGAAVVARNIRQQIEALALPHPGSPHGIVTVSVGLHAVVPARDRLSAPELLAAADDALYAAKAAGRNRVQAYAPGELPGAQTPPGTTPEAG